MGAYARIANDDRSARRCWQLSILHHQARQQNVAPAVAQGELLPRKAANLLAEASDRRRPLSRSKEFSMNTTKVVKFTVLIGIACALAACGQSQSQPQAAAPP